MASDNATRRKILIATAEIYSANGASDLSLRSVTTKAGVNLAAINYHFQCKEALIKAMVMKEVGPISIGRLTLLQRIETALGPAIKPTHVIACLALPLLLQLQSPDDPPYRTALLFRITSDETPFIREALKQAFQHVNQAFDAAFARAASGIDSLVARRRALLLCGAQVGSTANTSVSVLCRALLSDANANLNDILVELGAIAERLLSRDRQDSDVAQSVAEVLIHLGPSPQLTRLRDLMPAGGPPAILPAPKTDQGL